MLDLALLSLARSVCHYWCVMDRSSRLVWTAATLAHRRLAPKAWFRCTPHHLLGQGEMGDILVLLQR